MVNVKIGEGSKSKLTAESLLDFQVHVTLDGDPLSEREMKALLASSGGLVSLRGRWVELNRDKLAGALAHWKVERESEDGGIAESSSEKPLRDLLAKLRPYQQTGVHWLGFITRMRLGARLADDMGLGKKTIQVIALLLHLKAEPRCGAS